MTKIYRDIDGLTPLHHAVMFCNYDMIEYLITNGANVNAQSYALKLTRERNFKFFYAIIN
jgi:ankyrin repeat protein